MSPKTKQRVLVYLNPMLFLLALFQFCSGALLSQYFKLYALHQINAYLLALVILLHIYLNWSWIRANYLGKK